MCIFETEASYHSDFYDAVKIFELCVCLCVHVEETINACGVKLKNDNLIVEVLISN